MLTVGLSLQVTLCTKGTVTSPVVYKSINEHSFKVLLTAKTCFLLAPPAEYLSFALLDDGRAG